MKNFGYGADYAEYFEWSDGKPHDDLLGYFVTLDGAKIKIASKNDYILGVTGCRPYGCGLFIDNDRWYRYIVDEFGRDKEELKEITYVDHELVEVEETYIDENGKEQIRWVLKEVDVEKTQVVNVKLNNPKYDLTGGEYNKNSLLSKVGLIGQLRVRDDGTCTPNGYCTVTDGGIATATNDSQNGYRVMDRISSGVIRILFR